VLFPQIAKIVQRYLQEKVVPIPPANILDVFLSPYYGWVVERLVTAIKPDTTQGEAPEIPRYETNREPGSTAEVDFWASRDVREVLYSHENADGKYGAWHCAIATKPEAVVARIDATILALQAEVLPPAGIALQ
jgi:hypothetical protein